MPSGSVDFDPDGTSVDLLRAIDNLGGLDSPAMRGVVTDAAQTLYNLVVGSTPVGATGQAKRGWTPLRVDPGRGGVSFRNTVPYAVDLDDGLYPRVGPRTTVFEGNEYSPAGVYSRQAPGGMTWRVEDDQVLTALVRGIERGIQRIVEGKL